MRNTEIRSFNTDSNALAVLLTNTKKRKDRALAVPSALRRWLSILPERV